MTKHINDDIVIVTDPGKIADMPTLPDHILESLEVKCARINRSS